MLTNNLPTEKSKTKMFIEAYTNIDNDQISFSRQQGSDFAKQEADDFNPLHDVNAKRFCIPGDLLFAVILAKSGLHQHMSFNFSGMVNNDTELTFPQAIKSSFDITDSNNKTYLSIKASGEKTQSSSLINALTKAYVNFSGHTFPDILVKLMAENNVMINPSRPMVMYQSMSIDLETLDIENVSLQLAKTSLSINGKRGDAWLEFDLISENKVIGHGKKHMLLSGLRPYCQDNIDALILQHKQSKEAYTR